MPPQRSHPVSEMLLLLRRRSVATAMLATMLTFAGAFSTFTYFRPFLESITQVTIPQLSMLLLTLGLAGFVGTYLAGKFSASHLRGMLRWLPLALAGATLVMLAGGRFMWLVGLAMFAWGALNSAIPVAWSTWQTQGLADRMESGGGLMVAAIQLSIMLGAGLGGFLLDHISIAATFVSGSALMMLASLVVSKGDRILPREPA